ACPRPPARPGARARSEQQAGHPKQGFAQKVAADAGGDLIVAGGGGVLSRLLPQQAAAEGECGSLPEIQSGGAGQVLVDRALIRMQELVGGEFVVVHDPAAVQVGMQVGDRGRIGRSIERVVVVAVQQKLESGYLVGGHEQATCSAYAPLQHRLRRARREGRRRWSLWIGIRSCNFGGALAAYSPAREQCRRQRF